MSDRWKPEISEKYWFVDSLHEVQYDTWGDFTIDRKLFDSGNCFKTKEEARVAAEKVKGLLFSLHEPVTECNQLPKLTTEVFNRPDCPEWAKWAAVNSKGTLIFFGNKPNFEGEDYGCWSCSGYMYKHIKDFVFDASGWQNSLIERPGNEKALPDWCMVDNICWHKRCGYFKVTNIDDVSKRVDIRQVEDRSEGYLSFHTVCNEVVQARFRPYKANELKSLVGKSITLRDGSVCLCTAWSAQSNQILLDNTSWTAEKLLNAGYAIDDKPCGVFEHLNEKGEWVE